MSRESALKISELNWCVAWAMNSSSHKVLAKDGLLVHTVLSSIHDRITGCGPPHL